jgi:hypothetical protein
MIKKQNLKNKSNMDDIHKDTFRAEDCQAEKASIETKLKNCNDLIRELVHFLEYEEAMTVDTRSQQRMSSKLIELGLWPSK